MNDKEAIDALTNRLRMTGMLPEHAIVNQVQSFQQFVQSLLPKVSISVLLDSAIKDASS